MLTNVPGNKKELQSKAAEPDTLVSSIKYYHISSWGKEKMKRTA